MDGLLPFFKKLTTFFQKAYHLFKSILSRDFQSRLGNGVCGAQIMNNYCMVTKSPGKDFLLAFCNTDRE